MHKHVSQKEHFVLLERRVGEDLSSMAIVTGRLAASYPAFCLRPQILTVMTYTAEAVKIKKLLYWQKNCKYILNLAMSLDVRQKDRVKSSAELFVFIFGCVLKLREAKAVNMTGSYMISGEANIDILFAFGYPCSTI